MRGELAPLATMERFGARGARMVILPSEPCFLATDLRLATDFRLPNARPACCADFLNFSTSTFKAAFDAWTISSSWARSSALSARAR